MVRRTLEEYIKMRISSKWIKGSPRLRFLIQGETSTKGNYVDFYQFG